MVKSTYGFYTFIRSSCHVQYYLPLLALDIGKLFTIHSMILHCSKDGAGENTEQQKQNIGRHLCGFHPRLPCQFNTHSLRDQGRRAGTFRAYARTKLASSSKISLRIRECWKMGHWKGRHICLLNGDYGSPVIRGAFTLCYLRYSMTDYINRDPHPGNHVLVSHTFFHSSIGPRLQYPTESVVLVGMKELPWGSRKSSPWRRKCRQMTANWTWQQRRYW